MCSGIEAASCAWHPLGWQPQWFAEIEAFPSAVLAHRFPSVPNYGDFTQIGRDAPAIDLLVGGTPCQSFSVAGLRGGLADDRGNLALEFLRLAARTGARWVVFENVPGVLSSGGGRDFGSILGGLAELGYGFAYRVLDAQFFGVPQRRRRVFLVGYLGDWRPAAAVLFERASLRGDSAPHREARKDVAGTLAASTGGSDENDAADGRLIYAPDLSPALKARDYKGPSSDGDGDGDGAPLIAHTLRANGFDASEDGTGRGTPLVAHAFDARQSDVIQYGDRTGPLDTDGNSIGVLAFDTTQITSRTNRSNPQPGDPSHPLAAGAHAPAVAIASAVRRITPREAERLQGFKDDWTLIPYRGKPAADGPRYRALGNSMAVPCMRWIGERIERVAALLSQPTDARRTA